MFKATSKNIKFAALGLALMGIVTAAQADSSAHSNLPVTAEKLVLQDQSLKIGLTVAPPFVFFKDSISSVQGIDVDIINELQKRTGFKLEGGKMHLMNRDEMLADGEAGELDIVAGGMILNTERSHQYDFSDPYMPTVLVLVSRNGDNIHTLSDLTGRSLATEKGSLANESISQHANVNNITIDQSTSSFMTLYKVSRSYADATFIEKPVADFYMNNWPGAHLEIIEKVSDVEYLGLLFKKDPSISRPLQEAYKEMVADGTVKDIVNRYMNSKVASSDFIGKDLSTDLSVGVGLADND